MKKENNVFKYVWGLILSAVIAASIFAGSFIVSQVTQVVLLFKFGAENPNGSQEELIDYLMNYLTSADGLLTIVTIRNLIMSVAFIIILVKAFKWHPFGNPIKAFPKLTLPGTVLGAIGLELTISAVLVILGVLFPEAMEGYAEHLSSSGLTELTIISTLATAVAAPLCEELMFRGLTMKVLEKRGFNFWVANTIQALFFGIIHLNIVQGIYAFIMGFLFGMLYKRTGKLWATVLAHVVFNLFGTYGASLIYQNFDGDLKDVIIPALIGIVSLAFGIVLVAMRKEQVEEA